MRFNIFSFNQNMLCALNDIGKIINEKSKEKINNKLKVNLTDLQILQWFLDFYKKDKMVSFYNKEENNKEYKLVKYEGVLKEFPFFELKKQMIAKIFKKFVRLKILYHYHHKVKGSYSCYSPNEKVLKLLDYDNNQTEEETNQNIETLYTIILTPLYNSIDPSIIKYRAKYNSTNNNSTNKDYYKNNNSVSSKEENTVQTFKNIFPIEDKMKEFLLRIRESGGFTFKLNNDGSIKNTKSIQSFIKNIQSIVKNGWDNFHLKEDFVKKYRILKIPKFRSERHFFKVFERACVVLNQIRTNGYYPSNKKVLPKHPNEFLYNEQSSFYSSWFLYCYNNKPTETREYLIENGSKIAYDNFPNEKGLRDKTEEVLNESRILDMFIKDERRRIWYYIKKLRDYHIDFVKKLKENNIIEYRLNLTWIEFLDYYLKFLVENEKANLDGFNIIYYKPLWFYDWLYKEYGLDFRGYKEESKMRERK